MDPSAKTVEFRIAGKPVQARAGETLIHALWAAGLGQAIATGCVGGVCGACTVTLRFADGRKGGTDLACLCPVEDGLEVFPFPVEAAPTRPPVADPDVNQLRAAYPTLDRCTKCESCTHACPMGIPVMDSVLRMQKGAFDPVAEDFTTCIHCGLCRAVCEDKVQPHFMGMWVRRSLGQSREHPELAPAPDPGAEAEWRYLLHADPAERLKRARAYRQAGRVA